MIDGTIIRAHQHSAGARGGQECQALGKSCGGLSTKIHVKVDVLGRPLKFILTPGQVSEMSCAQELVADDMQGDYLLADKGYDSDDFREK